MVTKFVERWRCRVQAQAGRVDGGDRALPVAAAIEANRFDPVACEAPARRQLIEAAIAAARRQLNALPREQCRTGDHLTVDAQALVAGLAVNIESKIIGFVACIPFN